ncbi:class I ribonucleotide reductase maintenance protein YfaE [Shewanella intestini]|uniref:class I ribonucleotide reductase maintenance protein YfaE n=1 Tax=Shewanella TaxID=22 RepID=UPI001E38BBCC|nr:MULTISPECIES: class I ribonucleotide reductase maintenance protein YfaE [Shewanella]
MTCNNPFKKAPIVSINGQPVLLYTDNEANLLEALELKQIEVFSECRNGFCGSCKTKINQGSVKYINDPIVELEANECLPCCCIPDSNLDLDLTVKKPANLQMSKSTLETCVD